MGQLFHGWRRKTGLVMLVIACLFAMAWIRSQVTYDFFSASFPGVTCRIASLGSTIRLIRMTPPFPGESHWDSGELKDILQFRIRDNGEREIHDEWEGYDVEWRWDFAGCHFGVGSHMKLGENCCEVYAIPYLFFVIPLTLISAWMILSKPRKQRDRADEFVDGTARAPEESGRETRQERK